MAGVGSTPASRTSMPAEARPATVAAARNSPDARGSRPTTATGRWPLKAPTSAEHVRRGDGEIERELGGDVLVRHTTDAVRAEESSHACSAFPRGCGRGAVADVLARQYRPARRAEPLRGPCGCLRDPAGAPTRGRNTAERRITSRAGEAVRARLRPGADDVRESLEVRGDAPRALIGHDPADPTSAICRVEPRPVGVGHEHQLLGEARRVPEGRVEVGHPGLTEATWTIRGA